MSTANNKSSNDSKTNQFNDNEISLKKDPNNVIFHVEGLGICCLKEMNPFATFWDLYIQLASNYNTLKNKKINFGFAGNFIGNWELSLKHIGLKDWDVIRLK